MSRSNRTARQAAVPDGKENEPQTVESSSDSGLSFDPPFDNPGEPNSLNPSPTTPTHSSKDAHAGDTDEPAKADSDRPFPDPFGVAGSNEVGVHLRESRKFRQMQIQFDDKPGPEVLELLKGNGYRWQPQEKVWAKQLTRETAYQTRVESERLFQEVVDVMLAGQGAGQSR